MIKIRVLIIKICKLDGHIDCMIWTIILANFFSSIIGVGQLFTYMVYKPIWLEKHTWESKYI